MNPHSFATSFSSVFTSVANGLGWGEIGLFKSLRSTIRTLSSQFIVEEYHGGRYQVKFVGAGAWGRKNARCELCDLAFVVFSTTPRPAIRVSFLQAKSARKTITAPCSVGTTFPCNLEQWDLLSRRPAISGHGLFSPPPTLLSGAHLASVGSFGFFYQDQLGDKQVYYSIADQLNPPIPPPRSKYSHTIVPRLTCQTHRTSGGYREVLSCENSFQFALELASQNIGTPIVLDPRIQTPWDRTVGNWLLRGLRELRSQTQAGPVLEILEEQLLVFDEDEAASENSFLGAKSVTLIKTDA